MTVVSYSLLIDTLFSTGGSLTLHRHRDVCRLMFVTLASRRRRLCLYPLQQEKTHIPNASWQRALLSNKNQPEEKRFSLFCSRQGTNNSACSFLSHHVGEQCKHVSSNNKSPARSVGRNIQQSAPDEFEIGNLEHSRVKRTTALVCETVALFLT